MSFDGARRLRGGILCIRGDAPRGSNDAELPKKSETDPAERASLLHTPPAQIYYINLIVGAAAQIPKSDMPRKAALVTELATLIKRVRRIFFKYTLLNLGKGGRDPIPPSSYSEDALVKLCELIRYDLNTLECMMNALTASYPDDRGKRIDAVHAPVTGAFGAELLRLHDNHEFAPAALLTGFMNLSGIYG